MNGKLLIYAYLPALEPMNPRAGSSKESSAV